MALAVPASSTDLANLALDLIEQNAPLADVEDAADTSAAAKAVRRAYLQCWDETLQAAPWNFARKRASLAALEEEPAWGFDYYYQLPSDYLNMQEIEGLAEGEQWSVEETAAGVKAIAIDLDAPLNIAYTYQVRTITRAPPLFLSAFVARLAAAIAAPISKNSEIQTKCWNIYNRTILEAQGADGREQARGRFPDSRVVSVRD
jgi:hypothetical protein